MDREVSELAASRDALSAEPPRGESAVTHSGDIIRFGAGTTNLAQIIAPSMVVELWICRHIFGNTINVPASMISEASAEDIAFWNNVRPAGVIFLP